MNKHVTPEETQNAPHNLAAEMAVLGALLYDNNTFQRIDGVLLDTDFYAPANAKIFTAARDLIHKGRVADGVTLKERFDGDGSFGEIGGARYLATLLDAAAFGPEIIDYAQLIRDLAIRRNLMSVGSSMMHRAQRGDDAEMDGMKQIENAEKELYALAERGAVQGGFVSFEDAVGESIRNASIAYARDGGLAGIPTGLDDLDHKLGGLHRSDLIILAGRPSMGKTALATNIAFNAAKRCKREKGPDDQLKTVDGGVVGFYSLEMSSEQLAGRILADVSEVPSDKIRRGDMDEHDYERLRHAAAEIEKLPLYIDDTGGISISQLAARARRLQRTQGLDLLIVDYLQLITTANSKGDNRVQEVSQITMSLKALAKELHIPIIALSQLSRKVEERDDKRPQLSDLRESGSIEQDADVVMFVFRESYYLERQEPDEADDNFMAWKERMETKRGKAEVIVSKQRHGPIGKVELAFNPARVRFGNLAPEYHSDEPDE